jgi:two-component system NarL family sensor kinase
MSDLGLTVVVGVMLILFVFGLVVWLLLMNNMRRIKHRVELAELNMARDRAVMQAEREARQQTMAQIGRDLHDDLGQLLTVVQIAVEHVHEDQPDSRLEEVLHTLEHGIEEVRLLGRSFNADMWVQRSFPDAVEAEVARMERAGVAKVRMQREGEWPDLAPGEKTILFRVYQELVNNALKHGRNSALDIRLIGGTNAVMIVSDNGPGFAPNALPLSNGLSNIQHRCELIGFRAQLSTAPGEGCTWRIMRR